MLDFTLRLFVGGCSMQPHFRKRKEALGHAILCETMFVADSMLFTPVNGNEFETKKNMLEFLLIIEHNGTLKALCDNFVIYDSMQKMTKALPLVLF